MPQNDVKIETFHLLHLYLLKSWNKYLKAQEDIIYQLRSIASLTTELKKVFYASNSKKWNDVYQKLKVSLDVLVQDAMNMDLYCVVGSAESIRNMMEGLKGRRAGRGGRGRKNKSSISRGAELGGRGGGTCPPMFWGFI